MSGILCIVVPCYNEEEALPTTARVLRGVLSSLVEAGSVRPDSRILFVDDGSADGTWRIVRELHEEDPAFCGIRFASNAGHQNAVFAGLMEARKWADMAVTIDADLQDDPGVISEMVEKCRNGAGVVCGVRSDRKKDSFFKRVTAQTYYRFLEALGCRVLYNHADFRLMDKPAMDRLSEMREQHLFLRGAALQLGRPVECVYYSREERKLGKSKYTLRKMLRLAADGVTDGGTKPLRLVGFAGLWLCLASLLLLVFSVVAACLGYPMWNWKIVSVLVLLVGGLILTGLGILGAYLGRIWDEVRGRPQYWIDETLL